MDRANINLRKHFFAWIFFGAGIVFAASLIAIARHTASAHAPVLWLAALASLMAGSFIACLPYSSSAFFFEMFTICLSWLVFRNEIHGNLLFFSLPLVAAVFISVCYPVMPRLSPLAAIGLTGGWILFANEILKSTFNVLQWSFFAATLLMLLIFALSVVLHPGTVPRHIDVLLCSYSSNTAHFTGLFTKAVQNAGANVTEYRFHHYRDFVARYTGDALVIAFPIIGWKPPWPMLNYLFKALPRGNGKPAYILYTSAGGPENAGILVWLLLTLKGYRVAGRSWGIYPVNVPMFRLGPVALWRWLDSIMPFRCDTSAATEAGRCFAEGKPSGFPFIFWPFFLWIIGIIIDNSIVDRIYRNHTFKKRCNGCGICVRFCPAQRLRIVNGYPKLKGTCAICLGCVNVCPTNAMQIWFVTEYGRQYTPKWPSLLPGKKAVPLMRQKARKPRD